MSGQITTIATLIIGAHLVDTSRSVKPLTRHCAKVFSMMASTEEKCKKAQSTGALL